MKKLDRGGKIGYIWLSFRNFAARSGSVPESLKPTLW